MYNGIGLTTVRGSGTNGYVQRNMAHVSRQRVDRQKSVDKAPSKHAALRDPRKASAEIMDHKRKREVEVKVLALRESLEVRQPISGWEHETHRVGAVGGHKIGGGRHQAELARPGKVLAREEVGQVGLVTRLGLRALGFWVWGFGARGLGPGVSGRGVRRGEGAQRRGSCRAPTRG